MPEDCIFCAIITGSVPANKVWEDASVLAFLDINPRNPGHTLVVPKQHAETIFDLPDSAGPGIFTAIKKVGQAVKQATSADGISISASNGRAAGQIVPHLHFHIIPRFNNEGPPGLEGILAVKKFDPETMQNLASQIGAAVGSSAPSKKAAPRQEPAKAQSRPPVERQERPERSERPRKGGDDFKDDDEFEDLGNIDFDI